MSSSEEIYCSRNKEKPVKTTLIGGDRDFDKRCANCGTWRTSVDFFMRHALKGTLGFETIESRGENIQMSSSDDKITDFRKLLFNGWVGCSNHGCIVHGPNRSGMHTNASCHCLQSATRTQLNILAGRLEYYLQQITYVQNSPESVHIDDDVYTKSEKVYICKGCGHMYQDDISSCDCNNEPFSYTEGYVFVKDEEDRS